MRILFEATGEDVNGNPDEAMILVPLTGDIDDFNMVMPGQLRYFRFQVEFDVPTDADPIELEFLRVPFRF